MELEHTDDLSLTSSEADGVRQMTGLVQSPVLQHILQRGHAALEMLYEAALYAQDLNRSMWDFSLEIGLLREGGLAHSDLRWMLCKGLLEQAGEIHCNESGSRRFHPRSSLSFTRSSCFVLTEAGQNFVRETLNGTVATNRDELLLPRSAASLSSQLEIKPCWDRDRQELRVAGQLVKQFKVPAPNQEIVLAAFHEENWPVRIDDPLPPRPDVEPKRRLHDTINSLNRNQKTELMRFFGDGSGQGVRWELGVRSSMPLHIRTSLS
jgi:hypothetical protein